MAEFKALPWVLGDLPPALALALALASSRILDMLFHHPGWPTY